MPIEYSTPVGKIASYEYIPDKNIWDMVDIYDININSVPTICIRNGEPILRAEWDYVVEAEDEIVFLTLPQGGTFSDLLRIVASIALAIVAAPIAGFIAGALAITSATAIALIQAGVVIAGSFLIQAILPPTAPATDRQQSASPTYSLAAQGNQARLFQPIPKLYGNHILYPDYVGQPWYQFQDNKQILHQCFCLGLGKYEVDQVRIEDTVLWDSENGLNDDFVGISIEIVNPGQAVTLFHTQVINASEVSDLPLNNWSEYNDFDMTPDGKIKGRSGDFALCIPGQRVVISGNANAGEYVILEVGTRQEYIICNATFTTTSNNVTVALAEEDQWVGPFTANTSDTITNRIQIDFVLPQGLFYAKDNGKYATNSVSVEVQGRLIDSAGLPLGDGSWTTLGTHTYERATLTPQRITEEYYLSDGRYEVRVRRTTEEYVNNKYVSKIYWAGMKAFIPDDNVFEDITVLAVQIDVSGQLTNNSSQKINTIQTAVIPVYFSETETWANVATRSIAWAAYDIATNVNYGGKYPTTSIDLDRFVYLDGVWNDRGDYFDAVFDTKLSVWDVLGTCLRVGRAHPIMIGGTLSIKRRALDEIPRGVFTPENIVRGSFRTEHMMFTEETSDDIIIEFLDRRTWRMNEVTCALSTSTHLKPERVQLIGVTDREQAWREGIFMAAYNEKNRIAVEFTTELAGRILTRGDYIIAAHDLYEWGQSGTVEYYIPASRVVALNRPVELTGSEYVFFRKRNGQGYGPIQCSQGDDEYSIVLDATDLATVVSEQGAIADIWAEENDQIKTNFIICEQSTDYKRLVVVSGTPQDNFKVDLVLLTDDPSVYNAENVESLPSEEYPYGVLVSDGRARITTFTAVKTSGSSGTAPDVDFDWSASNPVADSYILQISYDGTNWLTIYEGTALFVDAYSVYNGVLHARVAGIIDDILGEWKTFIGQIGDVNLNPLPVASVTVEYTPTEEVAIRVSWPKGVRAQTYNVRVYSESVVDSGTFNTLELEKLNLVATSWLWSLTEVEAAGGAWENIQVRVESKNGSGTSSSTNTTVTT